MGNQRSLTQLQGLVWEQESQLQVSGLEGTHMFPRAWRYPDHVPGTPGCAKL